MALDLREEKVGKKEFWVYCSLFGLAIILSIPLFLGAMDGAITYNPEFLSILDKVFGFVVSVGTLPLAYYVNKAGDGKRFWYRYISLGLPIGIFTGYIGILVLSVAAIAQVTNLEYYGYTDLGINMGIYVLTFYLTWRYMRVVAGKTNA